MRIPSTSDLVQAHSNRAYDKMEVISDHIHEIMALYDWIFNLREYLATKLAMYVSLTKDELISGQKSFLKTLRAPTLRLTSIVESLTDESEFTIGEYNGDPALLITFSQEIDDDTVVGTLALAINRATSTPYFAIPPTKADEDTSAVRLDYLNQVIAELDSGADNLKDRVLIIENKLADVLPFDSTPTEGSTKGVTSDGIYKAIDNAISNIDFPDLPVATTEQKGIMQVGEYLTVNDGLVGVDADALATYIRSQLNIDSSINGSLLTYSFVTLGSSTTSTLELPVDGSNTTKAYLGRNSGNGNKYLEPVINLTSNAVVGSTEVKCSNLSTGSSNYYIPVRTIIILVGMEIGLPTNTSGFGSRYTWEIKCWFRNKDYILTSEDKTEINDQATEYLATRLATGTWFNGRHYDPTFNDSRVTIIPSTGSYTIHSDVYYDTGALS